MTRIIEQDTPETLARVALLEAKLAGAVDELRDVRSLLFASQDRERRMREALHDIATNFDHDSDAHKYGTTCRACAASAALASAPESPKAAPPTEAQARHCPCCAGGRTKKCSDPQCGDSTWDHNCDEGYEPCPGFAAPAPEAAPRASEPEKFAWQTEKCPHCEEWIRPISDRFARCGGCGDASFPLTDDFAAPAETSTRAEEGRYCRSEGPDGLVCVSYTHPPDTDCIAKGVTWRRPTPTETAGEPKAGSRVVAHFIRPEKKEGES